MLGSGHFRNRRLCVAIYVPLRGREFSLNGDLEMLGQFNLRYHLASALLRRPITFAHLSSDALYDANIARVLRKVHLRVDPSNQHDFAPATVSFTLRDGRVLDYTQMLLPGSRQQPMTSAEFQFKAQQCGNMAGLEGVALLKSLQGFETSAEIPVLPRLIS